MTRSQLPLLIALAGLLPALLAAQAPGRLRHPETRRAAQVDDYFGTAVADPYRWLEDDTSAETQAWVEAQNAVTFAWLEAIPEREAIRRRLTELWNYERYGLPSREGAFYVFTRNDGLQNQSVLYRAAALDAAAEVLLDPNTLSPDGTVALAGADFSQDGRHLAYATSSGGSDWQEWRVREVASGRDLDDVVRWSKFSGAAWHPDGSGFYYSRYAAPQAGEALTGVNRNQQVFFHALGTSQERDRRVYERPDRPDWFLSPAVTEDGAFLLIVQFEGTDERNRVFVQDLRREGTAIEPFLDAFDASYTVVGNDGDTFYVLTDKGATRKRLVAIERGRPQPEHWRTLVPEGPGREVLAHALAVGDRFVTVWLTDAHERLRLYRLDGSFEKEIALPALGSLSRSQPVGNGLSGKRKATEFFYSFASFSTPATTYRYDLASGTSAALHPPRVGFRPEDYETRQVFYASKDGTRVPLFVSHRKGLRRDGGAPTLLYGYGGFNVPQTPGFSPANLAWMELGGVYAVAALRGGGEYGREWHEAGRLERKQNVFDDFIAAAEHLVREGYTRPAKLAVMGGSNGGLLVGAVVNQRPDLFGAALPAVGVMDMLRFHLFTIGWAWKSDYGSAETRPGFETLYRYSPLHNLKPGTRYPAVLVTTADHDDRVVPAHSFKYAAALQAAQAGEAPVLIRIETRAGHGAGKPTSKTIEEKADQWAFLVRTLGMELPEGYGR